MDPFLRWHLLAGPAVSTWTAGGATVVLDGGWRGKPTLNAVGPPAEVAPLLVEALEAAPDVRRVTLPRGTVPLLPDRLPGGRAVGHGDDWDWMWTTEPPPHQPGEDDVVPLDAEDEQDVAELLEASSPRTSVRPGDDVVATWWGVRDAGRLVACGADAPMRPGVPHLAGLAVLPGHRGRGLGAAVTAAIARHVLSAGAEVSTLGMYADNEPARRVYLALGYHCEHRFSSRVLLAGTASSPAE